MSIVSSIGNLGSQLKTSAVNLYRVVPRDYKTLASAHKKKMGLLKEAGVLGVVRDVMVTASKCVMTGVDLLTLIAPKMVGTEAGSFAFLVHPRDITDIWRCYPASRYLPDTLVMEMANFLPPRIISPIRGVVSRKTGQELRGYLLAAFVAPKHIIENPTLAATRAVYAAMLGKKRGLSFIGLGALIPFLTRYGSLIKKYVKGVGITTGHAYTSLCIAKTTLIIINDIGASPEKELIAIVGAAGSTGSASAWALADRGARRLLLIDRKAKEKGLEELKQSLQKNFPALEISLSTNNRDIMSCRVIITVTNSTESIIEEKWIKPGMIFIDDAQPPNVSKELADSHNDILVVKVLVRVPGLDPNFDFGLGTAPDVTFTCLGEVALLASLGWQEDHTIGYAKPEQVRGIDKLSVDSEIELPVPFYGYEGEEITSEMIRQIGSLWQG